MNIAPSGVELLIQRLRWHQAMVKWPEEHSQVISLLFGRLGFENAPNLVRGPPHRSRQPVRRSFRD
eukprot:1182499-Pyramimonas_sp.AAC.1